MTRSPLTLAGILRRAAVAPALGEHTDEVVGVLAGSARERLDDRRARKVIA